MRTYERYVPRSDTQTAMNSLDHALLTLPHIDLRQGAPAEVSSGIARLERRYEFPSGLVEVVCTYAATEEYQVSPPARTRLQVTLYGLKTDDNLETEILGVLKDREFKEVRQLISNIRIIPLNNRGKEEGHKPGRKR